MRRSRMRAMGAQIRSSIERRNCTVSASDLNFYYILPRKSSVVLQRSLQCRPARA